jgi:DNA-binding MarR family transcriptional regulator
MAFDNPHSMTVGELHRLARVLQQIAQSAATNAGERYASQTTVAIVEDIRDHPGSAIKDIVKRVGVAQSLVSRTVETLASARVVTLSRDPKDGRRTLVSIDRRTWSDNLLRRGKRPIEPALESVLPGMEKRRRRKIVRELELLAAELLNR